MKGGLYNEWIAADVGTRITAIHEEDHDKLVLDDKEIRKLERIKNSLNENVRVQGDVEQCSRLEIDENLEAKKNSELKNAFEIMLESRKGGYTPSNTPRKRFLKKKIGERKSLEKDKGMCRFEIGSKDWRKMKNNSIFQN